MEKIQLAFEPKSVNEPSPNEVAAILKSNRRYKNLGFNCRYPGLDVLSKFAESTENLNLQSISFEIPLGSVKFPKLKSLELGEEVPSRIVDTIFAGVEHGSIEKLAIHCDITDSIISYFKKHNNITELTFNQKMCRMFESQNVNYMRNQKIKKVYIMNNFYVDASDVMKRNIKSFIHSQLPTVNHVLLNLNRREMIKTAMEFPKLKILEMPFLLTFDTTNIPVNYSVAAAYFFLRFRDPEEMLLKMPNLQVLQWNFYEDFGENLEMIARTCRKLRILYFAMAEDDFEEIDVHEAYEEMIIQDQYEINTTIQLIRTDFSFKLSLDMVQDWYCFQLLFKLLRLWKKKK